MSPFQRDHQRVTEGYDAMYRRVASADWDDTHMPSHLGLPVT